MKEQEAIKLLEKKGYKIKKPEVNTTVIDNTEYELKQHDNGKILSAIKIPKGKRLLKPWEAQRLWDLGHLRDNWLFVENTNEEMKKEGKVARFYAGSDYVGLDADRYSSDSDSVLGVVFAKDLGDKK